MKIIKGDLIKMAKQGHFDAIVHGCNCFNIMGKGIALTIKNQFPEAYKVDCATEKGDATKLGSFSVASIRLDTGVEFSIFNAYTQFTYWDRSVPVLFEYDAFQEILDKFCEVELLSTKSPPIRWGFPLIGCGLAGGDKQLILSMIKNTLVNMDVTIVEYVGNK